MFGLFSKKEKKKPYPKLDTMPTKGYVEFEIVSSPKNDFYATVENQIDVRRIESWMCNLFQEYFQPKYDGIIDFKLEHSLGCMDTVNVRYSMFTEDNNYNRFNASVREHMEEFITDTINFINDINKVREDSMNPIITGCNYNFSIGNSHYSTLQGENQSRLLSW